MRKTNIFTGAAAGLYLPKSLVNNNNWPRSIKHGRDVDAFGIADEGVNKATGCYYVVLFARCEGEYDHIRIDFASAHKNPRDFEAACLACTHFFPTEHVEREYSKGGLGGA